MSKRLFSSPLKHRETKGHPVGPVTDAFHNNWHEENDDVVEGDVVVDDEIDIHWSLRSDKTTEFERFQKQRYENIPSLSVETLGKLKKSTKQTK